MTIPHSHLLMDLVDHAVNLSIEHVNSGGIPFTALVADSRGKVLGTGANRVHDDYDPTAHAEVVAIRNACIQQQASSLQGMTLIASGEPCAMCYICARCAGISQIVFAVNRHDAAKAGFDYRSSYELLATDPLQWPIQVFMRSTENAYKPFELWQQRQLR